MMTMEEKLLRAWNPSRCLRTNKELGEDLYHWYAIDSLDNVPKTKYGGHIRISKNGSECRWIELADDLFVVRVLTGSVVESVLASLGFERIPEDVLAMEFPA